MMAVIVRPAANENQNDVAEGMSGSFSVENFQISEVNGDDDNNWQRTSNEHLNSTFQKSCSHRFPSGYGDDDDDVLVSDSQHSIAGQKQWLTSNLPLPAMIDYCYSWYCYCYKYFCCYY
jgi:hypothetical protein